MKIKRRSYWLYLVDAFVDSLIQLFLVLLTGALAAALVFWFITKIHWT